MERDHSLLFDMQTDSKLEMYSMGSSSTSRPLFFLSIPVVLASQSQRPGHLTQFSSKIHLNGVSHFGWLKVLPKRQSLLTEREREAWLGASMATLTIEAREVFLSDMGHAPLFTSSLFLNFSILG